MGRARRKRYPVTVYFFPEEIRVLERVMDQEKRDASSLMRWLVQAWDSKEIGRVYRNEVYTYDTPSDEPEPRSVELLDVAENELAEIRDHLQRMREKLTRRSAATASRAKKEFRYPSEVEVRSKETAGGEGTPTEKRNVV